MEPDVNGVAGTIYNYDAVVENGVVVRESTQEKYDSVDSYAAAFLLVLGDIMKKPGISPFFSSTKASFPAYLTRFFPRFPPTVLRLVTKPTYPVKYLMDNCEVYASLNASLPLIQAFVPASSDP